MLEDIIQQEGITSNLYKPFSERKVENGYLDIYLERDPRMPEVEYEWVLELKYLRESEKDSLEEVKEKLKQALLIFIEKKNIV